MKRLMGSFGAALALAVSAQTVSAQNVLVNPSFEETCFGLPGWTFYGNVQFADFYFTSGIRALKTWGPFCCPLGYTGFFQDVPTTPGEVWIGSSKVTSPTWDALSWDVTDPANPRGTHVFVELQFLDADRNLIHAAGLYRSPALNNHTDALPVELVTDAVTAPEGAAFVRIAPTVEQGAYVGGAAWWDDAALRHPGGENVLLNPSFENLDQGCLGSGFKYWVNFGNGGSEPNVNPRTGTYAAKLFGGYYAPIAGSGWWQESSATAGTTWTASAWGRSAANDYTRFGNDTFLTIEFFDASGANISGWEVHQSPWRSEGVPVGENADFSYRFYQTGEATAPEGTAKVRCLIYQRQENYAGGATWWDDVELLQTNARTCFADYNQDGGVDGSDVESFFVDWEAGVTAADVNADGGVDGGDVETFFIQWEAGGCD